MRSEGADGSVLDRLASIGCFLARHPWLVYLVATALAFPVLEMLLHGQNALQYAHDVFDDDVPALFTIASDWRTYGPSLWDPHLTAGNALFAQFALSPVTPDVLLSFVLPPFLAYALNVAGIAFVAGWGTHLFLRDSLRLSAVAAFAGGLIAAFGFWHYILGYAVPLFPLMLWSLDRAIERPRFRSRATALAIGVAVFMLAAGLIQIVLLEVAVAVPYALLSGRRNGSWRSGLARFAGIWAVAGLLAAPILAAVVAGVADSQRAIYDLSYLNPQLPQAVREAVSRYSEILSGIPVRNAIGGPGDIYGTWFVGAAALPVLAISLVRPRGPRARYLLVLLFLIPVIDLAATTVAPALQDVPLLETFKFVRVRHIMPMLLAFNVALGLDWLVTMTWASVSRSRKLSAAGLAAVALLVVIVQGVVALRRTVAGVVVSVGAGAGSTNDPALQHQGFELASVALWGGLVIALVVALVAGLRFLRGRPAGAWPAGAVPPARAVLPVGLAALLVLGITGEQVVWARAERYLDGNLATWASAVDPTPGLTYIAGQTPSKPGRILLVNEHENRAMAAGLDTVGGYETIYPLRYHELFGALIRPELAQDPVNAAYYDKWGNRAYAFGPQVDTAIADLLGVRWLYANGVTLPEPGLVPRFHAGTVTVYENPSAFPRAFIVHQVRVSPDRPALVTALGAATRADLRSTAYLTAADANGVTIPRAGSAGTTVPSVGLPITGGDMATLTVDTPDTVAITTRSTSAGLLVLADTYAPGWTVTVDGRPASIIPTDDALRGVAIQAGTHLVTFQYRPIPVLGGATVSGLTLLGLIAWWAVGALEERRRRHS